MIKKIYTDEKIKLRFEGEDAFRKFVFIVHILQPLFYIMIGFFLGNINIAIVALLDKSSYIAAIFPCILIFVYYTYWRYLNNK